MGKYYRHNFQLTKEGRKIDFLKDSSFHAEPLFNVLHILTIEGLTSVGLNSDVALSR